MCLLDHRGRFICSRSLLCGDDVLVFGASGDGSFAYSLDSGALRLVSPFSSLRRVDNSPSHAVTFDAYSKRVDLFDARSFQTVSLWSGGTRMSGRQFFSLHIATMEHGFFLSTSYQLSVCDWRSERLLFAYDDVCVSDICMKRDDCGVCAFVNVFSNSLFLLDARSPRRTFTMTR